MAEALRYDAVEDADGERPDARRTELAALVRRQLALQLAYHPR